MILLIGKSSFIVDLIEVYLGSEEIILFLTTLPANTKIRVFYFHFAVIQACFCHACYNSHVSAGFSTRFFSILRREYQTSCASFFSPCTYEEFLTN